MTTALSDDEIHYKLVNSLLYFTQIFFTLRTNKKFIISTPPGRESHYISICRALTKVFDGKTKLLRIHIPPRYGKTELVISFVAWAMAQYPDSNFQYVSYGSTLAEKQTKTVKEIIEMQEYKDFFSVKIKHDAASKGDFETTAGGSVFAAGAAGSITGRGAGIKNCRRFGGCIIIDDIHKPDEATSDTIRERIKDWYYNTLESRRNSMDTPIIFIGHKVHEDDLAANLNEEDGWEILSLPAIDVAGNPLHPEMHDLKTLRKKQEKSPYVFAAQYQQDPQPAGGGIFQEKWFTTHDIEPDLLATFITADSAETKETYNDATVFSFWGLYKILHGDMETGDYALHWIDCEEIRVEPKDLEDSFMSFYTRCMKHKVKPRIAAIEKKSTGVTLLSVLEKYQGLQLIDIQRTKASGSKTERFLEIQQYLSSKLITLPLYGKHTKMCIDHCKKITANNSHRFDDIADTMYDAIKIALIDRVIISRLLSSSESNEAVKNFMSTSNKLDRLKKAAYSN